MRNPKIKGQITIDEYLEELDRVYPVEIFGICDDAYCPRCNYGFMYPEETDLDRCPHCGTRVDWAPWHRKND